MAGKILSEESGRFHGGWPEFSKVHKLDVGDALVFELIKPLEKSKPGRFMVHIFKAAAEDDELVPLMEENVGLKAKLEAAESELRRSNIEAARTKRELELQLSKRDAAEQSEREACLKAKLEVAESDLIRTKNEAASTKSELELQLFMREAAEQATSLIQSERTILLDERNAWLSQKHLLIDQITKLTSEKKELSDFLKEISDRVCGKLEGISLAD